jgi:hypothetical protein
MCRDTIVVNGAEYPADMGPQAMVGALVRNIVEQVRTLSCCDKRDSCDVWLELRCILCVLVVWECAAVCTKRIACSCGSYPN